MLFLNDAFTIFLFSIISITQIYAQTSEKGIVHADRCEVCKFMARELQDSLTETGKNKEKIMLGRAQFNLNTKNAKIITYSKSETRLIESIEEVCKGILKYNMHKEREGSRRFEKGMSTTFKTLHGLVDRGVKVELGIPEDLWDEPSAEVTQMKRQCDRYIELYEEDIESWYFDETHFDKSLVDYLCKEKILTKEESTCLDEVWTGSETVDHKEKEESEEGNNENSASDDEDSDVVDSQTEEERLTQERLHAEITRQMAEGDHNGKIEINDKTMGTKKSRAEL